MMHNLFKILGIKNNVDDSTKSSQHTQEPPPSYDNIDRIKGETDLNTNTNEKSQDSDDIPVSSGLNNQFLHSIMEENKTKLYQDIRHLLIETIKNIMKKGISRITISVDKGNHTSIITSYFNGISGAPTNLVLKEAYITVCLIEKNHDLVSYIRGRIKTDSLFSLFYSRSDIPFSHYHHNLCVIPKNAPKNKTTSNPLGSNIRINNIYHQAEIVEIMNDFSQMNDSDKHKYGYFRNYSYNFQNGDDINDANDAYDIGKTYPDNLFEVNGLYSFVLSKRENNIEKNYGISNIQRGDLFIFRYKVVKQANKQVYDIYNDVCKKVFTKDIIDSITGNILTKVHNSETRHEISINCAEFFVDYLIANKVFNDLRIFVDESCNNVISFSWN